MEEQDITSITYVDEAGETHTELLARCAEERRIAKEKMLARNAERMADLKAKRLINDGETLEEYDTRTAAK